MSLSSYRRNVRAGATGAHLNTCFPSALEQISPNHRFTPDDYVRYVAGVAQLDEFFQQGGQAKRKVNPFAKKMFAELFEKMGCSTTEVSYLRVTTSEELQRVVEEALSASCRVALDLDYQIPDCSHPVGLVPQDNGIFRLVSNHVPFGLRFSTLDQIYGHLDMPKPDPSTLYPFKDTNVTILPPG